MEVLHKLTALSVFRSDKLFIAESRFQHVNLRNLASVNPRRSYSQSTSQVTSISLNEMNSRILLSECQAFEWTVEHFSGNLSEKDEKKVKNTWGKNVILEILNAVM